MPYRAIIFSVALVWFAVGLVPSPSYAERIVSKEDADLIFSLTRSQWEAYIVAGIIWLIAGPPCGGSQS